MKLGIHKDHLERKVDAINGIKDELELLIRKIKAHIAPKYEKQWKLSFLKQYWR